MPFTNINVCSTFQVSILSSSLTQLPSIECTEVEIYTTVPLIYVYDNGNTSVGFPIPNGGSYGAWYTMTGITNANQLSAKGANTTIICRSKYYRCYSLVVGI
jgi:hypothetical protein